MRAGAGHPGAAGAGEPHCHRVPERPGDKPQQHRAAARRNRQAGRGPGSIRAGAGDPGAAGTRESHRHRVPEHLGGTLNNLALLDLEANRFEERATGSWRPWSIRNAHWQPIPRIRCSASSSRITTSTCRRAAVGLHDMKLAAEAQRTGGTRSHGSAVCGPGSAAGCCAGRRSGQRHGGAAGTRPARV